jgi:hypothetical protein
VVKLIKSIFCIYDVGVSNLSKKAASVVVLGALLTSLLIFAPAVSATTVRSDALIIHGHSPIVMLVTDPNGYQIGCTNWTTAHPCNSDTSLYFVNNIPTGVPYKEGPATYNFASNFINIPHPVVGVWTVQFFGTGSGTYTITTSSCNLIVCYNIVIAHGTITVGQTGETGFSLSTNGQVTGCSPIECII